MSKCQWCGEEKEYMVNDCFCKTKRRNERMKAIKVWQCGHCGVVYSCQKDAAECCDGCDEESYRCGLCNGLYASKSDAENCCKSLE